MQATGQNITILELEDWSENNSSIDIEIRSEIIRLLNYKPYNQICKSALIKLKEIELEDTQSNIDLFKEWLLEYETLGSKTLLMFLIDHCNDTNELFLHSMNLKIDSLFFQSIINFCNIFNILYWQLQYHKSCDQRNYPSKEEYYYYDPQDSLKEFRLLIQI